MQKISSSSSSLYEDRIKWLLIKAEKNDVEKKCRKIAIISTMGYKSFL